MNYNENINIPNLQNKKSPAPPKRADIIIAQALYFLLGLFLPVVLFFDISTGVLQVLSILAAVAGICIIGRLTGSTRTAISFSLVLVTCFVVFGTLMCGMIAAFIGSVCVLAYTLIKADRGWFRILAFLPALLSYLIATALLGSFVLALPALLHLPAALALAYCFSKGLGRVSTICRTSAAMIITAVSPAVIYFLMRHGTDISVIPSAIEAFKSSTVSLMVEAVSTMYSEVPQLEATLSLTDITTISTQAVNAVFNLLPAIVVISFNIVAFALQSVLTSVLIHGETDRKKIVNMVAFDMSLVSAIVFLFMSIAALVLSAEKLTVWSVTAENVALILMPGLIFIAFAALRGYVFTKRSSCFMVLLYIGSILLLFYMPIVMLPLAAVAGAVLIILNNIAKNRINRKK